MNPKIKKLEIVDHLNVQQLEDLAIEYREKGHDPFLKLIEGIFWICELIEAEGNIEAVE